MLLADRARVGDQVRLREHHALRLAGGARGVHEERERLGCHLRERERRIARLLAGKRLAVRIDLDHEDLALDAGHHLAHLRRPIRRDEDDARIAMVDHVAHLLGLREQVHRVHAVAARHGGDEQAQRREPVGHHDRDVRARRTRDAPEERRDAP
jgi:hypothetical protein